jgi:hypothetical protein
MSEAGQERMNAAALPEGDVIRILLEQHARVRELFTDVKSAEGQHKQHAFDELRALLAVHETAEEMVLRPVSEKAAGKTVTHERNQEESAATEVLMELEGLEVSSAEFDRTLTAFEADVLRHAENEETLEFPAIVAQCDDQKRAMMGTRILIAESVAPTHPHPSAAGSPTAQYLMGPFASLVDRTRDLIRAMR